MQANSRESRPKVAVITRTKDRPVFLRRAMQSVLSQTFEDWVHVIVNDGGDPETVDLLLRCEAENYRGRSIVLHHAESQGMQNASNAGIAASSSDYLVIHDDDDTWQPEFLAETVGALEEEPPQSLVRGVVTQTTQIFEEFLLDGRIMETGRQAYQPFAVVTLDALRKGNLFAPIAFVYRRDVHEQIGMFRQEFDVLGDHDFNLRFVRHFDLAVLEEAYANYHWRQHSFGNTVTRQRGVHRKMLAKLKNVYARDVLVRSSAAIGRLDQVPMPPPEQPVHFPFKLRNEEPDFKRELPNFESSYDFDVLSMDIFDTVLLRRTYRPIDVFQIFEQRAVEQIGLPPGPYALARREAEERARKGVASGEVSIEEIYQAMGELMEIGPEGQSRLLALEWELEKEFLYPDPRWLAVYQKYRDRGKRIIFISDMYWSGEALEELMSGFGFDHPEVFVSCGCGGSKHHGELQRYVIEKLGVPPESILHIGDNYLSDYVRCKQAGIQAFHWWKRMLYQPWSEQVELPPRTHDDPLSLRLIGEARRMELVEHLDGSPDPLMERLGREVAGPLYFCFLNWVVRTARKDGVRRLVFLGRDGYYWEKTLGLLNEKEDLGLEFSYLHASRKVFAFASFKELDDRAIEFLSTPNPRLCVRDFIDRTGLDSGLFADDIQSAGFSAPDEVLTTDLGGDFLRSDSRKRLRSLFTLMELHLLDRFKRCREGLLYSLKEKGFDPDDSAIVDIGWQGSSANALAHILDLKVPESLRAYYFGTWKAIKEVSSAVCPRSYLIHKGEPQDLRNLLFQSVNFFETLHSAPFPVLLDYAPDTDGGFQPVFSECDRSGLSEEEQAHLWHGVEAFLSSLAGVPFPVPGEQAGLNYLERVLHRILCEPSPEERRRIGGILHSEGFGLEVNKPLIMRIDPKMRGQEIMKCYWGSNWKRGFLAELDEKRRNFVFARLSNTAVQEFLPVTPLPATPKPTPWHKHIYRWYRRRLGDPKYVKRS